MQNWRLTALLGPSPSFHQLYCREHSSWSPEKRKTEREGPGKMQNWHWLHCLDLHHPITNSIAVRRRRGEKRKKERKGGSTHRAHRWSRLMMGKGRAHLLSRSVNTFPTFGRAIMCGCEEYSHSLSQVALPQSSPWQTRCKQLSTRCLKAGEGKNGLQFSFPGPGAHHHLPQDLLCERTRCKKHWSGVWESKTS